MLDVPPFTAAEGAELLRRAGGDWLAAPERRNLVLAVDGHALAVSTLAAALRDRPPVADLNGLQRDLAAAGRTDARVNRVLQFYSERLSIPDRLLVATVSLFTRPVAVASVAGRPPTSRPPLAARSQACSPGSRTARSRLTRWSGTHSGHWC
jgi:hypothetical protein